MPYHSFSTHVELEIEVSGHISPADPGKYDGPWENCYPGTPAEAEDIKVELVNKKGERLDITKFLSDSEIESLEEDILIDKAGVDDDYEAERHGDEMRDERGI